MESILSDKKIFLILRYAAGVTVFVLAAFLARFGNGIPSTLLFFTLMFLEAVLVYYETENILDLRLLLSFSWLGGIALSSLKLSELQSPWSLAMWFSVGGFYFLYLAAFDLVSFLLGKRIGDRRHRRSIITYRRNPVFRRAVLSAILILTAVDILVFILECFILHFNVPIFANWSYEAYSNFHVTGLHYFTVSLVLVPPLTAYYLFLGQPSARGWIVLIICCALSLLVPFLILSKMQMLLTLAFPIFVFLVIQEKVPKRVILAGTMAFAVLVLGVFIVLMRFKDYPENYLEGVFRFKNQETPLALQYPYIYIVNNFENLNLLTVKLQRYSYGIREMFPFFALTGLKFVPKVGQLYNLEQYLTCEELSTLTILYHAYGDFGVVGTFVFGTILGAASAVLTDFSYRRKSIGGVLFYVQFAMYMALSFFTTWFSDATTWFYFIATGAIVVYIRIYFRMNSRGRRPAEKKAEESNDKRPDN